MINLFIRYVACSGKTETANTQKQRNQKQPHCNYSYFKWFSKRAISSFRLTMSRFISLKSTLKDNLRSLIFSRRISNTNNINALACSSGIPDESNLSYRLNMSFSTISDAIIYYPHGKYCLKQAPITHKAQAPKTHNIKFNLVADDSSLYSLAKSLSFKSISFPKMVISSFVAMFCTIELILSSRRVISSFIAILSATADIIVSKVLIVVKACSSDIPDARNSLYRLIMSVLTIISAPLKLLNWLNYSPNDKNECTNKCIDKNFQQHYSNSFLRHEPIVPIPNTICKFISIFAPKCVYNQLKGVTYA